MYFSPLRWTLDGDGVIATETNSWPFGYKILYV